MSLGCYMGRHHLRWPLTFVLNATAGRPVATAWIAWQGDAKRSCMPDCGARRIVYKLPFPA